VYVSAQSNGYDVTATVPGNYKVRVCSLNSIGTVGTKYIEETQLLLGKFIPPTTVTNFYATRNGDIINFTWTAVPDVDIANYEIRLGTVWTTATPIGNSASNSYSFTSKRGGSFLLRALSTSGIYSASDVSVVVADNSNINVVVSYDDGAAHFPGTLTNAVNIGTGIVPTNGAPWSAHTLPWTSYTTPWGYEDAGPSGSYTTNAIDAGLIATSVVTINPTVIVYTVPQPWSSYTEPWNFYASPAWSWLGLQSAISASFQISTSLDNITWSAFQPFVPGSYNFRYIKIRVNLLTTNLTYLPELTGLVVNIDVPDRIDHYKNTAISSSGTTITFTKPFVGIQTVQTTLQSGSAGDTVMVTAKTTSSVTVTVYNKLAVAVSGIVDVDVFGYGAVG
jgi:hypothetical protein